MSSWRFPPTPSFTASKYLKYGYVYDTAFKPGERYRSKKDMEQAVPGYSSVRRELRASTEEVCSQRLRSESLSRAPPPVVSLRNNAIGFTTVRAPGNTWVYSFEPSVKKFLPISPTMECKPGLEHLYKYYARRTLYEC